MTKRLTITLSDEALRRLESYCEMAGVTKGGCIGMLICQTLPPARISSVARVGEAEPAGDEMTPTAAPATSESLPQDPSAQAEAEDDWPFDLDFEE